MTPKTGAKQKWLHFPHTREIAKTAVRARATARARASVRARAAARTRASARARDRAKRAVSNLFAVPPVS